MFRDSANRPLSMEVRSLPTETDTRILFIAADFWKRAGIAIEPVVIPQQQTEDREYRAKFPTFSIQRGGYGPAQIPRYGTAQSPTAENRYSGPQLSGYSNAEFDALRARFQATIPTRERVQVFGDIVNHMTENVITLPLFYEVSTHLVTNRASNILPNHKDSTIAWNSHLWDLR